MTKEKPSVKEELRKIKESRKEQEADKGTSAWTKAELPTGQRVPTVRPNTNSPREKRNTKIQRSEVNKYEYL